MIKILFASSAEYCYAQIAEMFASSFKLVNANFMSAYIGDKDINHSVSKILMENKLIPGPVRKLSEIADISFDIFVILTNKYSTNENLFLPGYPAKLRWKIPEPTISKDGTVKEDYYIDIINKIENYVKTFITNYYLEAFAEATGKTHFILDSLPIGIIAHDMNRYITYFNKMAEEITGFTKEETIGKDCNIVFPNKFCGSRCLFCSDHENFESTTYPVNIITKQGERKNLEMSLSPVKDNFKVTVGVLASFKDCTNEMNLENKLRGIESFSGIIGKDPKMLEVFDLIKIVADSNAPVLIYGASGTGKELVASAIHNEGNRSIKNFVTINCGALPETLLESELFGHVKGAFTGAIRDKKGRFELADNGTILLDEIGDISPAMQVKLLRVLQEGTFERLGSEKTTKVNVRVISATNKNLETEIKAGRFREDLYYRLSVVPVKLPALKERKCDIPLLIAYILKKMHLQTGENTKDISVSEESLNAMMDYNWPGNIRELQNWIQFALIKCGDDKVIRLEHLPIFNDTESINLYKTSKNKRKRKLSHDAVHKALEEANGNKVKAAKILGVGRATLYRFLE